MTEQPLRRWLLWPLLVALLIIILDRVSKFLAVRFLGPSADVHAIPLFGPFRLVYLENTGVSFGKLQEYSALHVILGLVVALALSIGFRYLLTSNRWANLALGLILGGAWGNMIDRISTALRDGLDKAYVVDFVDPGFWPVFNVADSAISVGGVIFGVYLVFFQSRSREIAPKRDADPGADEETPWSKVEEPASGE